MTFSYKKYITEKTHLKFSYIYKQCKHHTKDAFLHINGLILETDENQSRLQSWNTKQTSHHQHQFYSCQCIQKYITS